MKSTLLILFLGLAAHAVASPEEGRSLSTDYASQFAESDLVVIATAVEDHVTPISCTSTGGCSPAKVFTYVQVETRFDVKLTLKGTVSNDTVKVHHYRLDRNSPKPCFFDQWFTAEFTLPPAVEPAAFISMGPRPPDYLLFLRRSGGKNWLTLGPKGEEFSVFEVGRKQSEQSGNDGTTLDEAERQ